MKKWMAAVFALVCVLALVSCSNTQNEKTPGEEKWDLIPMIMVDGVLYLDTGKSNGELLTSDIIDGEITSEVDGSERPTQNEQSNFGVGYSYRYGEEGTVEIVMNGKWWIFVAEEARAQIQFPSKETVVFHDRTFHKSDLSEETIEWLEWYNELSETEQLSISYIPSDLYELCGYEDVEDAPSETE